MGNQFHRTASLKLSDHVPAFLLHRGTTTSSFRVPRVTCVDGSLVNSDPNDNRPQRSEVPTVSLAEPVVLIQLPAVWPGLSTEDVHGDHKAHLGSASRSKLPHSHFHRRHLVTSQLSGETSTAAGGTSFSATGIGPVYQLGGVYTGTNPVPDIPWCGDRLNPDGVLLASRQGQEGSGSVQGSSEEGPGHGARPSFRLGPASVYCSGHSPSATAYAGSLAFEDSNRARHELESIRGNSPPAARGGGGAAVVV